METSDNQGGQITPSGTTAVSTQTAAPSGGAGATSSQPAQPHLQHVQNIGEALANLASFVPGFAGYKAVEDRRIADKHGGSVELLDARSGHGLRVRVSLPLALRPA